MTLKPPNPSIEPRFGEQISNTRLHQILRQIQQNQDFLCQQFPLQEGNLATGVGWQAPTFINSWADYKGGWAKVAYRKGVDGRVQIRGLVKHPAAIAATSTIFVLPVGFRPPLVEGEGTEIFGGYGNLPTVGRGILRVDINPAGEVVFLGAAPSGVEFLSLSQISFYPD